MKIARVTGQMVSTLKHPHLDSRSILVVEMESLSGLEGGRALLAVDTIGVGVGERVLVVDDGAAARTVLGLTGPIRTLIVGRVDQTSVDP